MYLVDANISHKAALNHYTHLMISGKTIGSLSKFL
jgi:hypothetical protein